MFESVLTAPVLFFFMGMIATWLRSDLEIPQPISKFLSVYLLIAIGMHGGVKLSETGFSTQTLSVMLVTIAVAVLVPLWSFFILRLRLDVFNSAAIAATYGSISAVTFVTAAGCLEAQSIPFSGHMVAAMALMEFPAIVVGVLLARYFSDKANSVDPQTVAPERASWGKLLHDACASGPVLLLVGSLMIGLTVGAKGWTGLQPVLEVPFKGILTIFLLDMGINAARHLRKLPESTWFLVCFAIGAALVHAGLGIVAGAWLNVSRGDALLLAILFGSASYIAVPAAARLALPQANPGLYLPMSLGITFPFNVVVGIPLYLSVINLVWS